MSPIRSLHILQGRIVTQSLLARCINTKNNRPQQIRRRPWTCQFSCPISSFFQPVGPSVPGQQDPEEDETQPTKSKSKSQADTARDDSKQGKQSGDEGFKWSATAFKMAEAALTTFASVAILGAVGYSYNRYYKHMVLAKMENAFAPGDPVLDLAAAGKSGASHSGLITAEEDVKREHWVMRDEQKLIDAIVSGQIKGHYHLLVGEKGTGKSSMLIDAMAKVDGEGIAMFDAHADPEIFRIRLGKALDFEYHEDNIGSLFSIRGPRDASALLDVERAFNKLEKVAIRRRGRVGKPLVLIINSAHLLRDDEEGRDLLELLQQRAEQWAASNLATVIFNSDDYWVYERLKNLATRMNVIPILDLGKSKAIAALRNYRIKYRQENPDPDTLERVYNLVGGRISYLARVAKTPDMLKTCHEICRAEKTWFLNKCGILGAEMDDDVMDQQKYASAAMVLARELVRREQEMTQTYDDEHGYILPQLPLHEARHIMTRADFIQSYDAINIFAIDSNAMVRADSIPMMNAFREVCSQDGFDDFLEATLDRIGDIESLGRTRELTIKDLWKHGKYRVKIRNENGGDAGEFVLEADKAAAIRDRTEGGDDDEEEEDDSSEGEKS